MTSIRPRVVAPSQPPVAPKFAAFGDPLGDIGTGVVPGVAIAVGFAEVADRLERQAVGKMGATAEPLLRSAVGAAFAAARSHAKLGQEKLATHMMDVAIDLVKQLQRTAPAASQAGIAIALDALERIPRGAQLAVAAGLGAPSQDLRRVDAWLVAEQALLQGKPIAAATALAQLRQLCRGTPMATVVHLLRVVTLFGAGKKAAARRSLGRLRPDASIADQLQDVRLGVATGKNGHHGYLSMVRAMVHDGKPQAGLQQRLMTSLREWLRPEAHPLNDALAYAQLMLAAPALSSTAVIEPSAQVALNGLQSLWQPGSSWVSDSGRVRIAAGPMAEQRLAAVADAVAKLGFVRSDVVEGKPRFHYHGNDSSLRDAVVMVDDVVIPNIADDARDQSKLRPIAISVGIESLDGFALHHRTAMFGNICLPVDSWRRVEAGHDHRASNVLLLRHNGDEAAAQARAEAGEIADFKLAIALHGQPTAASRAEKLDRMRAVDSKLDAFATQLEQLKQRLGDKAPKRVLLLIDGENAGGKTTIGGRLMGAASEGLALDKGVRMYSPKQPTDAEKALADAARAKGETGWAARHDAQSPRDGEAKFHDRTCLGDFAFALMNDDSSLKDPAMAKRYAQELNDWTAELERDGTLVLKILVDPSQQVDGQPLPHYGEKVGYVLGKRWLLQENAIAELADAKASLAHANPAERTELLARIKRLERGAALGPGGADFESLVTGPTAMANFRAATKLLNDDGNQPWSIVGTGHAHEGRLAVIEACMAQVESYLSRTTAK